VAFNLAASAFAVIAFLKNLKQQIYWRFRKVFALNPLTVSRAQSAAHAARGKEEDLRGIHNVLSLSSKHQVVFDIGANCGYWSRYLIEAGFDGQLYLFEPIPHLLSLAASNLSECNVVKVFVNAAAGHSDGTLEFALPTDGNIGWITPVLAKADKDSVLMTFAMCDISKWVARCQPTLIKIDVEGFEPYLLNCVLQNLNERYLPTFLVELGWGIGNPSWRLLIEVAEALSLLGYYFCTASDKRILSIDELKNLEQTLDVIIHHPASSTSAA